MTPKPEESVPPSPTPGPPAPGQDRATPAGTDLYQELVALILYAYDFF
ncbi:MAG: hypothetical protein O3C67_04335 [Cyanobacteria bacterium]|nr:hypothetical protein [Cyanobacteriota bacterium]MEB3268424.1 hypothetical protein [Leptolyngbya sp.]